MIMAETAGPNYDTHAAVRRLTEAGIPEPHAEAVVREQAHLIEHNLATKADIAAVQADIEKLRLGTKADIEKLRLETKADIAAVQADIDKLRLETKADIDKLRLETKADIERLRLETKAEFESVRGEIIKAKLDMIKWLVGTNITLAAVVITVVITAIKLL